MMLDHLESLENSALIRLEEMTEGLPDGKFKCFCGEIDDLDHAVPSSNSPWSSPMCRKCGKKKFKEEEK